MAEPLPPWLERHRADPGIGRLVDHTLLSADATEAEVLRLADEALELGLGQVCVNGQWVGPLARRLGGRGPVLVAVVGFPLGASGASAKAAETRIAVGDGAGEVDMVMALGFAKAGRWGEVGAEIAAVVEAAAGRLVKVILETAASGVSAGMVKTSTGFHAAGGATVEAVARLREAVGPAIGVKASGGIRTPEAAMAMLRAGADRIGSSSAATWGAIVGPVAPTVGELFGEP